MKRYAIFILSNGRAEEMSTYDILRKSGYTGEIKIIVDNLDEQVEKYKKRYGDDVYVFDKRKAAQNVDCMINGEELRSVVYARNYAEKIAEELNFDYYAEFDDDVTDFSYKWIENGKLKTKKIENMDKAVKAIIDFMEDSKCDSLGICHTGILFGGANGPFSEGIGRNFNQTVFMRTGSNIFFKGLTNQDVNALFLNSRIGKLMLELYCICHTSPERGTNKGGLKNLYDDIGKYTRCFTTVMCCPDICQLDDRNEILVKRKNAFPKIISGRYKK